MSRSDWLRNGAVIGAIAIASLILIFVPLYQYQQYQASERQETTSNQTQASKQQAHDACVHAAGPVDYDNCITNKLEASKTDKHSEYDLKAQQEMARWAFGMFLSGLIGLVITAAGVAYVASTLRATRAALDAANRSAKAGEDQVAVAQDTAKRQLRAYIHVDYPKKADADIWENQRPLNQPEVGNRVSAFIKILNRGQTPAYGIEIQFSALFESLNDYFPDFSLPYTNSHAIDTTIQPGMASIIRLKTYLEWTDEIIAKFQAREVLYVWGERKYVDAFGSNRTNEFSYIYDKNSLALWGSVFAHKQHNRAT